MALLTSLIRRYLARAADIASVLSLAGLVVPLPPHLDDRRPLLIALASIGLLWLLYSPSARRHGGARSRALPDQPYVVLVGGPQSDAAMRQICESEELYVDEYIQFTVVRIDNDHLSDADQQVIANADAIIVFPDVTREATSSAHRWLRRWAHTRPLEITRYYPEHYAAPFETDFKVLPFRSPEQIVRYASEFLFRGAVVTLLEWDNKLRRSVRLNWVSCGLLLLAIVVLGQSYLEYRELIRTTLPPLATIERRAGTYESWRGRDKSPRSTSQLHGDFTLLNSIVEDTESEVTRILDNSGAKAVSLFVPSADGQQLLTVVSDGKKGYPVDAVNSIAGCSVARDLVVFWEGGNDQTTLIRAWTRDGQRVGTYNAAEHALQLPGGHVCRFDARRRDGKTQLMCVPVGGGDDVVAGALCVALDEPSRYAARWPFAVYLLQQTAPIALVDVPLLVKEFPNLATD